MLHPHDPERADRHDHPEAVDQDRPDQEGKREGECIGWADGALHAREPDEQDDQARQHLDHLPDLDLPHAHEDLSVLGLRQRKVERSLLDVFHQLLHVWLDEGMDHAAEQDLHAEQ